MKVSTSMKAVFAAITLIMLIADPAQATPSISFSEATPVQPGTTVYSYTVTNSGPLLSGGFVTVYDFGMSGMITPAGALADPALFSFSRDLVNAGPPSDPVHVDNPILENIRATYIGTTPLTATNLGFFLIALTASPGTGFLGSDGYDGQSAFINSQVLGPANPIPSPVPEPVSLALLSTGLLGFYFLGSRRNRQ